MISQLGWTATIAETQITVTLFGVTQLMRTQDGNIATQELMVDKLKY